MTLEAAHAPSLAPWLCSPCLLLCLSSLLGCEQASPPPTSQPPSLLEQPLTQTLDPLYLAGIPLPSRQLLEASPRLAELKASIEATPASSLQMARDLAQLAWAQGLAEVGALSQATELAEQLIHVETSARLGALTLLIESGPCDRGQEAWSALKALQSEQLPPPWDREGLTLTERSWAQRCAPQLLPKLNQEITTRLPKLALKLSLALPKSLDANEQLKRALHLEAGRAYPEALKLLDELLKAPKLPRALTWKARYERARIQIERLRSDYQAAALDLDQLAKEPGPPSKQLWREARLLSAKAWSKAGKQGRAKGVYRELIKEWKHSDEAKTARFMIAFAAYEAGSWREAVKHFAPLCRHQGELKRAQRLGGLASRRGWTRAAEWYFAWSKYQLSARASVPFMRYQMGEGAPRSEAARRAGYWSALALEKHKPQEAQSIRSSLLEADSTDWYALLLRARYYQELTDLAPLKLSQSPPPPRELSKPSLTEPLKRLLLARTLRLRSIIPLEQARAKQRLRADLREAEAQDRYQLLSWARSAGLIELALRVSVGMDPQLPQRLPDPQEALAWQLAYPYAFSTELKLASEAEGLAETTLLSFIRKESAFQPSAESPAHARGLMQLLEKTALSIATLEGAPAIEGLSVEEINLLDPRVNILLGARYLQALSQRYHGQLPLIAAGYNAGPSNLNTWLKKSEGWSKQRSSGPTRVPLDLFVERVPFKEARGYIKRLAKTKCLYELLYGEQSLNECARALPLELDVSVSPGVAF